VYVLIKDTNNYSEIEHEVIKRGYVPHIRQRGKGKNQLRRKEDDIIQQEDGLL
jgi:hypothetical protein